MQLILILMMSISHAGWVNKTCTRLFDMFVVQDPAQYEQVSTDWLIDAYSGLGIRGAWNVITIDEAKRMNVMGAELRWRLGPVMHQFETPENKERIVSALELYQEFEGHASATKGKK